MRHALKKSPAAAATLPSTHATTRSRSDVPSGTRAKTGRRKAKSEQTLKDRDLIFILRNLATLTSSGVSLPKALGTLAEEKAL
jgi:type II secretory pathway component PulF